MKVKTSKKRILLEVFLAAGFLLIFVYYLNHHASGLIKLLTSGNISGIDDYLSKYGPEGKLLLILLQVIETVSIVLPASPVYICSGVLFGKVLGTIVCYGTNLILNLLIFLVAGKVRISPEHAFHLKNQNVLGKLITSAKHMDRVVLAMCLLPIVPNGMIPYLSAQTPVTVGQFMKALAIGSFPSILVYVCCGDILVSDSYKVILPVIIVLLVATAIVFAFRKQLTAKFEPKIKAYIEG